MDTASQHPPPGYALTLDVEYPDRSLNRLRFGKGTGSWDVLVVCDGLSAFTR